MCEAIHNHKQMILPLSHYYGIYTYDVTRKAVASLVPRPICNAGRYSGHSSIAQEFARIERIPERMNTKGVRKNIYSVKVTVITSMSQIG